MSVVVKNLQKFYGENENRVEVLKKVNCEIQGGDICVLLGPSGSGKSTLLNIIGGIETFEAGDIIVDNKNISEMKKKQIAKYRRDTLGFVFQFYNLISNLTVKENIEVCAYLSKQPLDIDDLLKTLGLWEHKDKFPNQLSGGQQQRCAIGRALVKNPGVILYDEPTGALDFQTSKEILKLIQDVNEKYHNTMIIVTHNQAIQHMAHQVMRLRDGQVIESYKNKQRTSAMELEW